METQELLKEILNELKENNRMLKKLLTNADTATEDAMHSYILDIVNKVDSIAKNINKIQN